MEELSINTAIAEQSEAGVSPKKKVKPGLAFAMSLLVPGSGQVYCGKNRGWITMATFAAAVLLAVLAGSNSQFAGMGLRSAIVLYAFSFLDAYYTAREVNVGIDDWVDNANPRIAAVLNLVTTGFGYFYLGHRGIGLTIFFGLKVLNPSLAGDNHEAQMAIGIVQEVVLALLAVHGWRLAHKELKINNSWNAADGTPEVSVPQAYEGMSPALPIALSFLMGLNYLALVVIGVAMPNYSKIDQSSTVAVTLDDGSQTYRNVKYGVSAKIDPEWTLDYNKDPKAFFHAEGAQGACEFTVMPVSEMIPTRSTGIAFRSEMRKLYPKTELLSEHDGAVGGRKSHVALLGIDTNNVQMRQRYTTVRKGLTTYVLIETSPATWADCDAPLESMMKSVEFE